MNNGFVLVLLSDMLNELGENETQKILSEFSCPKNKDVENFLKKKAIMFSKQGVSQTHLVYFADDTQKRLVGYFTLAIKNLDVNLTGRKLSSTLRKRLHRFTTYDKANKVNRMSTLLIGQLGKNFYNGNNEYISGDELLSLACEKVREVQMIAGGKFVYVECEDKECLKNFYFDNGFVFFCKRTLDKDEKDDLSGEYLLQLIKYLR